MKSCMELFSVLTNSTCDAVPTKKEGEEEGGIDKGAAKEAAYKRWKKSMGRAPYHSHPAHTEEDVWL